MATSVDIPNRPFFKASEVCSIAGVERYVLRSWETELPALGNVKQREGSRVYRRTDVELVLRIKELLFVEGLTLGAALRRLEEEHEPADPEAAGSLEALFHEDASARLTEVKRGLCMILDMLSENGDHPLMNQEGKRKKANQSERPVAEAKRQARGKGRPSQARAGSKRKRRTA